jgi:two-component system, OmpR family, KDP operon response regulator KdpE
MPSEARRALTILIVDDEIQIRRVVRHAVADQASKVIEASTGREAIDLAAAEQPELIVLDLGLPDMSGADVCREIRGWSTAPILVLSARHTDAEKVSLLNLGADDYITKPFSTSELQARIGAHLRRRTVSPEASSPCIVAGDLTVDLTRRTVLAGSRRVHLTPIEWELLRSLAVNQGRTMTHSQLFAQVWKRSQGDPQQYLRVHVASLRRKLEADPVRPKYIHTEPGVGYRFGAEG